MSRSGYTDDCDDYLAAGRYRGAVLSAIHGRRGQALLRELLSALDAMPEKKLYSGSFQRADGEFCTLGVLGAQRGTKMDDLGDVEDGCDIRLVGERFGIAPAMAAEIMYHNDEYAADEYKWVDVEICGPVHPWDRHAKSVRVPNENHPQERWQAMRDWVVENLLPAPSNAEAKPS